MPRIRKETSNRRSTNDRAKRRKQVKESKRKSAKAAKKSVQWKSKTPKDPGIPSEFPYKDQILAEVAEQRRIAAEEKEKKKNDKQRAIAKARALARGEPWESETEEKAEDSDEGEDSNEEEEEEEEEEEGKPKINEKDLNVGLESIAALSAKHVGNKLKSRPKLVLEAGEEVEEVEEVPVLINRDLPNLKAVLEKADVVVQVLDARDPGAYKSTHIEEIAKGLGKKVFYILNKIDTCPREAVAQWSAHLRTQHPTFLFRSATAFLPEQPVQGATTLKKGKGKPPKIPTGDAVGAESVLSYLSNSAKEKKSGQPLAMAVVGVTNVGKSAFVNSLLKRSALPVYTLASSSRGPTTTELPQEVEVEAKGQKILIIDTPGLSFPMAEDADPVVIEDHRSRDILLRSKGRIDRLKDPLPPINQIIARASVEDLMLMYSLPAFVKGDPTSFLSGVARANQLVKKKGELDLTGAARIVLRDWSVGKLVHFTLPSAKSAKTTTTSSAELSNSKSDSLLAQLYAHDEAVLEAIPTRKEKRKAGGLIKLTATNAANERKAEIEKDWSVLQNAADEESDDDDDEAEGDAAEGMDVDSEEEEEEQDEEEDEHEHEHEGMEAPEEEREPTPPPISNKQKRKRAVVEPVKSERPSKKVAFTPKPFSGASSKPGSKGPQLKTILKPSAEKSTASKSKAQEKTVSVDSAASVKTAAVKTTKAKAAAAPKKAKSGGDVVMKAPSSEISKPKVANKPSAGKAKAAAPSAKGEEAYDFGKFF